jgi:hypothetical protein
VQKLIAELKQLEQQLAAQQQTEREQFVQRVGKEETPSVKYSSAILEQRRYLANLIRARNYREAENVKQQLSERQREEEARWAVRMQDKRQWKLQQLEKRQAGELQALRVKLEAVFNERIKERDRKFEMYPCQYAVCSRRTANAE